MGDLEYLAFILILILVGAYFSQYANNTIPRLLFVFVGAYLLTDEFYVYQYLGLGFILAQSIFIFRYAKSQFVVFKAVGFSSYFIALAFYYKFLNFLKWIKSFFQALYIYFTSANFSKAKQNYEEANPNEDNEFIHEEIKEVEEPQFSGEYAQFNSSDDYEILGVSRSDDFKTIKKAWRKLIQKHHPDINAHRREEAKTISQIINGAYDNIKKYHN